MRIISLVPSLTHSIAANSKLKNQIVACTSFCIEPPEIAKQATIIGGTKDPNLKSIASLTPTHILVNEEENRFEDIIQLEKIAPTLKTFPKGPEDISQLLSQIGAFLSEEDFFQAAVLHYLDLLCNLRSIAEEEINKLRGQRFIYLIWRDPYMIVGRDTYISRLLSLTGLVNAYQGPERYPIVSVEGMKVMKTNLIFLASEPYPFRLRDWQRLAQEWDCQIPIGFKIDGRLMSWHGMKSLEAINALSELLRYGESRLIKLLPSQQI